MFETVAAVSFTALAVIWNRDDWPNVLVKMILSGLAVWGIIEALSWHGFIVALPID